MDQKEVIEKLKPLKGKRFRITSYTDVLDDGSVIPHEHPHLGKWFTVQDIYVGVELGDRGGPQFQDEEADYDLLLGTVEPLMKNGNMGLQSGFSISSPFMDSIEITADTATFMATIPEAGTYIVLRMELEQVEQPRFL